MRNRNAVSQVGLISVILFAAGILYGCYSRDSLPAPTPAHGKIKSDPLTEEELRKFASSVRRVDGDAEAYYQLALHFQENNRHKLAIDELQKVLQRNPAHAKAYNALGVSYDHLGDREAAIESYRIALRIDSKLDYVYNNLGYSYLLNGQNAQAVEAFKQAIAINKKEKRYRNNLGLAYVKLERYELACEEFRALDTAGGTGTFAKVMQELGKGDQVEGVLLALPSAPPVVEKPEAPVAKLPDLSLREQSLPREEPVASVTAEQDAPQAPSPEALAASAEDVPTPVLFTVAAIESAPDQTPTAAVIQVAAPPAEEESPYELKVSAAADPGPAAFDGQARDAVDPYPVAAAVIVNPPHTQYKYNLGAVIPWSPPEASESDTRKTAPVKSEPARSVQPEERVLVTAASTSAAGLQNAPQPKPTAEKAIIEIEVANGNGVKGSAGKVAQHLRRSGFKVAFVTNAQSHDHYSTKVFHRGNQADVQRVLEALPAVAGGAELYEMDSMGDRIRVLVGKDLVGRNAALSWGMAKILKAQVGG